MNRNEIIDGINTLLVEKFAVSAAVLTEENRSLPLIGSLYGMDFIALTYFFFEVMRLFGMLISHDDLSDYRFMTIDSVANVIKHQLSLKENSIAPDLDKRFPTNISYAK